MEGYVQTGIGIIVSLVLFMIGYRQTIGAKKERSKNAKNSVHRTVMRRMVLEEYVPIYKDLTRIIQGKAREFHVSPNDLLSEEQVLNDLFTEVFDSDLISPTQRIEIEKRISGCFEDIEKKLEKPTLKELQQLSVEYKNKSNNIFSMVLLASLLGALSSVLWTFFETKTFDVEGLLSGLAVLISSIAVISSINIFRKNKEIDSNPSKGSSEISSIKFETEVADLLKSNAINFTIEPSIEGLTPDFLVNYNGKKIVLEVKSLMGPAPLHLIKRLVNYLNKLSKSVEVDHVILVTKRKDNIPTGSFESNNVTVVPINNLIESLKNVS